MIGAFGIASPVAETGAGGAHVPLGAAVYLTEFAAGPHASGNDAPEQSAEA